MPTTGKTGAAAVPSSRVTLAELGRRTGLAKGTLHRVCGDLVAAGLLERRDHLYRLGRLMFELVDIALDLIADR